MKQDPIYFSGFDLLLLPPIPISVHPPPQRKQRLRERRREVMSSLHCTSDTTPHLLALLLADLLTLCCFLTSHPLPLACLLLSSPYLLPLLSFLSPLLASTSLLLLLTLLIASPFPDGPAPPSSAEFPVSTFRALLSVLMAGLDDEPATVSPVGIASQLVQLAQALLGDGVLSEWDLESMGEFHKNSSLDCKVGDNPVEPGSSNSERSDLLGSQFAIRDGAESQEIPRSMVEVPSRTPGDNAGENPMRSASARRRGKHVRRASEGIQRDGSTRKEGLQRDGSMRREKEWKRTLACKLYEERVTFRLCERPAVADRGEEMDFLWEAYEDDANSSGSRPKNDKGKKGEREEEEEEEGDADEAVAQLCCLQALRLSAGRMNLGAARPSLVGVSKVLKGIGLFQSVSRRRKQVSK